MTGTRDGTVVGDRPRRLLVGVFLFSIGVLSVSVSVPVAGLGRVGLWATGVLAVLGAVRVVRRRYRGESACVDPGDPERGVDAPVPGSGFDRSLGTFESEGAQYLAYPDRVRTALENAAVTVLGRYRGLPEDVARQRLRAGSWTDDPAAGAFLGDAPDPRTGFARRLRATLGGESDFRRGIRHTVAAVAGISGAEVGDVDSIAPDPAGSNSPSGSASEPGEVSGSPLSTGRWSGVGVLVLVCAGVGVLGGHPAVVLAGTVGIGVAAYAGGVGTPEPELLVRRQLSDRDPAPGERVDVTLTVRNEGGRLPDLRVVDGVPPALEVVEGTPRAGASLAPGGTVEVTYTVAARRGDHRFDPVLVAVRDLAGTREQAMQIRPTDEGAWKAETSPADAVGTPDPGADESVGETAGSGETAITCRPPLLAGRRPVPIEGQAAGYAGRTTTEAGGDGVEFHAVREYHRSDPVGRIDWKRYARTRELAAREFREERATTAVVVVDARPAAYRSPGRGADHAVDRGVRAAGRAFAGLESEGNRVGLAVLGRSGRWIPPATGPAHWARVREALATDPSLSPLATESDPVEEPVAWLRARLPADAQLVVVSPVCDDPAAATIRRLRARGYPVTALSPDPTAAGTPGQVLARVGRRVRLARLRDVGVRVVDWGSDEPLAAALARRADR